MTRGMLTLPWPIPFQGDCSTKVLTVDNQRDEKRWAEAQGILAAGVLPPPAWRGITSQYLMV